MVMVTVVFDLRPTPPTGNPCHHKRYHHGGEQQSAGERRSVPVLQTIPSAAGTSVTFTVTPVDSGTNPAYQWYVNNVAVGNSKCTFTSNSLVNGDVVTVVLTSDATPQYR